MPSASSAPGAAPQADLVDRPPLTDLFTVEAAPFAEEPEGRVQGGAGVLERCRPSCPLPCHVGEPGLLDSSTSTPRPSPLDKSAAGGLIEPGRRRQEDPEKWNTGTGACVAQLPGHVSHRYRDCVREVERRYRSRCGNYEPGQHRRHPVRRVAGRSPRGYIVAITSGRPGATSTGPREITCKMKNKAEGTGFEPVRACALPVFKTGAISRTLPPLREDASIANRPPPTNRSLQRSCRPPSPIDLPSPPPLGKNGRIDA